MEEADALTEGFLFNRTEVRSWFMGTNIPDKARTFALYAGGSPALRAKCDAVAGRGYESFLLS